MPGGDVQKAKNIIAERVAGDIVKAMGKNLPYPAEIAEPFKNYLHKKITETFEFYGYDNIYQQLYDGAVYKEDITDDLEYFAAGGSKLPYSVNPVIVEAVLNNFTYNTEYYLKDFEDSSKYNVNDAKIDMYPACNRWIQQYRDYCKAQKDADPSWKESLTTEVMGGYNYTRRDKLITNTDTIGLQNVNQVRAHTLFFGNANDDGTAFIARNLLGRTHNGGVAGGFDEFIGDRLQFETDVFNPLVKEEYGHYINLFSIDGRTIDYNLTGNYEQDLRSLNARKQMLLSGMLTGRTIEFKRFVLDNQGVCHVETIPVVHSSTGLNALPQHIKDLADDRADDLAKTINETIAARTAGNPLANAEEDHRAYLEQIKREEDESRKQKIDSYKQRIANASTKQEKDRLQRELSDLQDNFKTADIELKARHDMAETERKNQSALSQFMQTPLAEKIYTEDLQSAANIIAERVAREVINGMSQNAQWPAADAQPLKNILQEKIAQALCKDDSEYAVAYKNLYKNAVYKEDIQDSLDSFAAGNNILPDGLNPDEIKSVIDDFTSHIDTHFVAVENAGHHECSEWKDHYNNYRTAAQIAPNQADPAAAQVMDGFNSRDTQFITKDNAFAVHLKKPEGEKVYSFGNKDVRSLYDIKIPEKKSEAAEEFDRLMNDLVRPEGSMANSDVDREYKHYINLFSIDGKPVNHKVTGNQYLDKAELDGIKKDIMVALACGSTVEFTKFTMDENGKCHAENIPVVHENSANQPNARLYVNGPAAIKAEKLAQKITDKVWKENERKHRAYLAKTKREEASRRKQVVDDYKQRINALPRDKRGPLKAELNSLQSNYKKIDREQKEREKAETKLRFLNRKNEMNLRKQKIKNLTAEAKDVIKRQNKEAAWRSAERKVAADEYRARLQKNEPQNAASRENVPQTANRTRVHIEGVNNTAVRTNNGSAARTNNTPERRSGR